MTGSTEPEGPMYSLVRSGAVFGVDARPVRVETYIAATIPSFHIVGLPDSVVRESRERVYAAIKNSGFRFPPWRITINLAPANLPKAGSAYDLPIAVGILAATGVIRKKLLAEILLFGELALDGRLLPVDGAIVIASAVRELGLTTLVVPPENLREASVISGIGLPRIETLAQMAGYLNGVFRPPEGDSGRNGSGQLGRDRDSGSTDGASIPPGQQTLDLADVKGQESAKRALEVAAAGRHNILLVGPPGSGKTMLARRFPSVLDSLSPEEALETRKIHSVAGMLKAGLNSGPNPGLNSGSVRPFRAPHHTVSSVALTGGGSVPGPGEISLAHNGVLFLDELPEFATNALEALRQPLEEGRIVVSRARYTVAYPARFLLVCAMNPCGCGYATDPSGRCRCTPPQVQHYLAKVSGPLLDRIDLQIEVPAVKYDDLTGRARRESSAEVLARVLAARELQRRRFEGRKGLFANAGMHSKEIGEFCRLDQAGEALLKSAITKLGLSARAYDRILKVARTIADLAAAAEIGTAHLSEAIQYRSLDRNNGQGNS